MSTAPEVETPRIAANDDASRPVAEALADALFEAEAREAAEAPLRRPVATYRIQLHGGYRMDALAGIVDYLADLGISDCYLSPYLQAKPGSTHGYDVFDHGRINPEIADEPAHARLVERLAARGLGRVLDVVPNHMGISGPNRFWMDVLETGPHAPSARFFDIDWHPVKEELENRVLLPILEDQYGKVLEAGQLVLEREGGAFFLRYHDHRLPVGPKTYALILGRRSGELLRRFDQSDEHVMEYRSIWASAQNLPPRRALDLRHVETKILEKEVIKRRIERLCRESPALREFLDGNVALFRGTPGEPSSFDSLHHLLEHQAYRLAYWRVAAEEINYRRFFDINDLAGLRVEDPVVFAESHALIFRWIDEGGVTGLRIDHPDGLADPLGYFRRLQETLFLRACRRRHEADPGAEADWPAVEERLRARFRVLLEADPSSPLARRFPIIVEKILSRTEDLPEDWPIDGTVGYEYLNMLNGMFVEGSAADSINATYVEFTADHEPFPEVLYESKQLITRAALASELNMLARQLNRVSESDRRSRDFTLNELRRALREVIACFPVYRTYIRPGQPLSDRDRGYIEQAVARARQRNPTIDASVWAFVGDALMLEHPPEINDAARAQREGFVLRFQQITGPVQAKGLEDTAFYRQIKLASLNEVGADPLRFGVSPSFFHALNAQRLKQWPGSLATTATHDTKRGEDVRLRVNVLTELPEDWKLHLTRWSRWNARKKLTRDERPVPDAREEYLLYQVLLGAWPFGGPEDAVPPGFVPRIQQYMAKAAREAKLNTSWTDSDQSYVEMMGQFIEEILQGPDAGPFLRDFIPFQAHIARVGVVHSLSQVLLKLTSPGVPDVYQGTELWDLNLVDPDNRRPVDYDLRSRLLGEIRRRLEGGTPRAELARDLFAAPEDGAIKLYLNWTILNHRRSDPALYAQGAYRVLEADGERKANIVSFGRGREGRYLIPVAPRLVAGLMGEEARTPPLGREVWGDTRLVLPETPPVRRWRNLLTDEVVEVRDIQGTPALEIAELFRVLPVALLVDEPNGEG